MKKALVVVFALLAVGMLAWGDSRGPIIIRSDGDFTEENGVISGSGTPEDPFVIAGWEIQVPPEAQFGVYIGNTTKAFVLRGVRVIGALNPQGAAFFLEGVSGGRIEDCLVESSHHGLVLFASQGVTVEETYFLVAGLGLQVIGTRREHYRHQIDQSNMVNGKPIHYYFGLSDDTLGGIEAGHITVAGSQNVRLVEPRVEEGDGVVIAFSEEMVVEGADLFRNRGHGLMVLSSPRTLVRDCPRIANNARSGISVWLSPRSRVEGCGVYGNQVGIYVNASDRAIITGNSLAGNALGVLVTGASQEVEISDSLFYQNKTSVELAVAFGTLVERCAITDADVGVQVDPEALNPQVRDCSFIYSGYGLSIRGSEGVFERNFIAYANIGIIFEETYGDAFPVANVVRHN
ncbi:MAG TPA: right-handed parallel beta-helix repeat-containing protein, partial [Candidatus Acetothermia bacterium]|nr:right-handed parallel beta-helix repeat-containing protein [Candidatus Acetothermia bacterium]